MNATIGQIAGLAVQLSFGVGSIVAGVMMILRPHLFYELMRVQALCFAVMWCATLFLEWVKP